MSSKILVDELAGKTAAGNITITSEGGSATMQLQQGVAKAWGQLTSISTTAMQDSLNVASVTDNGTGSSDLNWSNVFNNDDYATTTSAERSSFYHAIGHSTANTATNHFTLNTTNTSWNAEDAEEVHFISMGDLA